MIGRKKPPRTPPPYHRFGDETEAATYALDGLAVWAATPGATAWLAALT